MRKLLLVFLALLAVSPALATTIENEEVEVDLATSEVKVQMEVEDMTSNTFSYFTTYPARNPVVFANGEKLDCGVRNLRVGSEIRCEPPETGNFTANLSFQGSGFVETRRSISIFRYTHAFPIPTERYSLKVLLPKGTGILNNGNVSIPVISPENAEIGSDGRRITVKWVVEADQGGSLLGESRDFQVVYEPLSNTFNPMRLILLGVLGSMVLIGSYLLYRHMNRENIENVYSELSEDEIEVLELLRENDGELLQKDVVNQLDYSKSKVSGTVSGLVEKGVLVKEKKGRSNQLSISKNYRG